MGDVRFEKPYDRVAEAADRSAAIRSLSTEEVVMALAAASRGEDPLVANVLATEALNRVRRGNAVLENISEGVIALDRDWRVTFANPAAVELLGYERDELLGERLHDLVHYRADGSPKPAEECVVAESAHAGRTAHMRDHGDCFRRKDGTLFAVELTSAPIRQEDEIEGVVLVISDISDEIEGEITIERLASVVEHSADAIVSLTPEGVITHVNKAVEDLLDYRAEELVGRHIVDLVPDAEKVRSALRRLRSGEPVRQTDMPHQRRDGTVVETSLTAFPVRDRAGRLVGISGIMRDVTEKRRLERERDLAVERERELHRSVAYRLATLLPAIAWGLGTVIAFRTLVLVWFVFTPAELSGLGILVTTTAALVLGGLVGVSVFGRKRGRMKRALDT